MTRQARRTVAIVLLTLTLVAFSVSIFFTSIWEIYVHYVIFEILRPLGIEKLPFAVARGVAFFVIMVPVVGLSGLIGAAFRPFIRRSTLEAYANQSRRIADAQKALREAVFYLEGLSKDVTRKFTELETLSRELGTMQALHEENASSLKNKIAFINKKPIWFVILTHLIACGLGVFGSVIANYIYDFMK